MRFSPEDPFDVARRYGSFALMTSGHSPCVYNVTYGRLDGWALRAFDFRCEVGHGTRRTTRHYGVIVAESELPMPDVLMWNEQDWQGAPLVAHLADGQIGGWMYVGDPAGATMLAGGCSRGIRDMVSLQTLDRTLMLCMPVRHRKQDYTDRLAEAMDLLRSVRETSRVAADDESAYENGGIEKAVQS